MTTFDELPNTPETATALHEAGHCAIAELLGVEVVYGTNRPDPSLDAAGLAHFFRPDGLEGRALVLHLESRARAALAGPVATKRVYQDEPLSAKDRDVELATAALEWAEEEESGEELTEAGLDRVVTKLERAMEDTRRLVHDPSIWRAIERVAVLIAERRTILSSDIRQILKEERCTT